MKTQYLLLLAAALLPFAMGCPKPANTTTEPESTTAAGEEEQAHVHEGDDALVWQREDLEHEGFVIALGHHGLHLYTGHDAEPAVMVTKEGQPVADAKVFVTLLDESGQNVLVEEQATVYEPTTATEPAHYAQADVAMPKDAKMVTLRYRIELPGASEFTQDVPVSTTTH